MTAPQVDARRRVKGMVRVPGASFLMGSEAFYPEERPVRRVEVDAFWMDDHPVTVAEFRAFVKATGLGVLQGLNSFAFTSEGEPCLTRVTPGWGSPERWRFGVC